MEMTGQQWSTQLRKKEGGRKLEGGRNWETFLHERCVRMRGCTEGKRMPAEGVNVPHDVFAVTNRRQQPSLPSVEEPFGWTRTTPYRTSWNELNEKPLIRYRDKA
jgi:hypothetical protein